MQGSSEAARELFQAHGTAIYRFASVLVRHREDAEDVVQETFLKLIRHLEAGGDLTNVRGWLFTVAAPAPRGPPRPPPRWVPGAPGADRPVPPPPRPDQDAR